MRTTRLIRDALLLFLVGTLVLAVFAVAGRVRTAYGSPEATVSRAQYRMAVQGQVRRHQRDARTIRRLRRELHRKSTLIRRLGVRFHRDLAYYLRLGADLFHVDRHLLSRVIYCESHNYQYAKNRSSTASGYGQWLDSTWASSGLRNFSVFDGLANVLATARLISQGGISHWNASRGCWQR